MLAGKVDLGIIGTAVKNKNIITRKYLGDEIVLAAPADYKMQVMPKDDFRTVPLLIREKGFGSRASPKMQPGRGIQYGVGTRDFLAIVKSPSL